MARLGEGGFLSSKFFYVAVVLTGLVLSAPDAHAQLAIDRLWVDLESASTSRSDLVVRNESLDKYYVTVSVTEVTAPGTAEEKRVAIPDPEALGLLVTPTRLILEPNQMRAIRIVSLNKNIATDRVYRVNVTPQVGEVTAAGAAPENRGLAIKLLAAFDVLVTVRPSQKKLNLAADRLGDFLNLSSTGNSNILLLDGAICPVSGATLSATTQAHIIEQERRARSKGTVLPADGTKTAVKEGATAGIGPRQFKPDECVGLPARRLYAGNVWTIPASADETLRFNRRDGASRDLEPITIRCGVGSGQSQDSGICDPIPRIAEPERQSKPGQ
jgi:hypothetical protein